MRTKVTDHHVPHCEDFTSVQRRGRLPFCLSFRSIGSIVIEFGGVMTLSATMAVQMILDDVPGRPVVQAGDPGYLLHST
jgi:hypothetical protein